MGGKMGSQSKIFVRLAALARQKWERADPSKKGGRIDPGLRLSASESGHILVDFRQFRGLQRPLDFGLT